MSADDDTELRDLLVQTLEKNGTLAKIRAQLRASVFLALEEQEGAKKKAPLLNEKAKQFGDTEKGRLCAEAVAEFLESLNLDATLSVFLSEFQLVNRRPRQALATALELPSNSANDGRPLLSLVLESERGAKTDKDLTSTTNRQPLAQLQTKTKQASGDGFVNGASYFGGGKTFNDDHDDNSDDEDFFDSAGRANAKKNEKPLSIPSTVTVREKNIGITNNADGKLEPVGAAKKEDQKSGSSSLSFLGDLPTLSSSKNRPALPSLTKEKGSKDADFMKLLGDSLDDTDRDSPKDSARLVPGLDLKKLQDIKADMKPEPKVTDMFPSKNGPIFGKSSEEAAAKVQRKDSSADEEISEEIAEDLEVDDLLDSARSSRQLSF